MVIVVGNGPVGVHFVNQMLKLGFSGGIQIFGEEESGPYNRVKLSSFLNGEMPFKELENPISSHPNIVEHLHCRISKIDVQNKQVQDAFGQTYSYDELIIATGSTPHLPNIDGRDLRGIYCFRHIKDAQALLTRRLKSRQSVVIGGGLLGLETAKAMLRHSTKVLLVHHSDRLMNRQLDEVASKKLQDYAEQCGIEFRISTRVTRISGDPTVDSIELSNGEKIQCDTVIFATGIRPNTGLALEANLAIRRGVKIDSQLQTTEPHIYAIGECADYQGQVFGLVAPGLEQASVLAKNLTGDSTSYRGSSLVTELKVLGLSVFSMGKVGDEFEQQIDDELLFKNDDLYRRILIEKGRVVGAIFVGDCTEIKSLQAAIEQKTFLWPWQKSRFIRTGLLFPQGKTGPASLPDMTIICNCQQVSAGQIRHCLKQRGTDFASLQKELQVSTVCGTCKPLVDGLMAKPVVKLPVKKALLVFSLFAACFISLIILLPRPSVTQSVQTPGWDWLWTDGLARQISGFTILGLTLISLLFSLRKRISNIRWLSFDFWRGWHVLLTSLSLLTLMLHTGTSMGEGINRWLIINFLAVVSVGVLSGLVASFEGRLASTSIKSLKRMLVWGHIVTFWPLPVLLTYHVLSVYYF